MSFDDFIQKELGKVGLAKEPFSLPKFTPKPSGIQCVCKVMDIDAAMEEWPSYFVQVPGVGEFVASKSGKRYIVISVIHVPDDNGSSHIELELGKKRVTDVTPTEGGAINRDVF